MSKFESCQLTASIPILLFFGTQYFSKQNNQQQQKIATQRYQQEALIKYLEQISQLLLNQNLRKESSEARTIARARTLSTLRELDSFNKGLLIKFLTEAKLISKMEKVISLIDADLTESNLEGFNLIGTNLYRTNLHKANLSGANLIQADLKFSNLSGANLIRAVLKFANLEGAKLIEADLSEADLGQADFSGADLSGADLSETNLIGANLSEANLESTILFKLQKLNPFQIKSACNWTKAIYTEAKWDFSTRKWIPQDKVTNQVEIEKLEKDTTSNPHNQPNCKQKIWTGF